ncbi:hypothetical protein [Bradyrhizobium cenepequi]
MSELREWMRKAAHLHDPDLWPRLMSGANAPPAANDAKSARRRTRKALDIPDNIKPNTLLRLEVAACISFPDGSLSVSAMRREAAAGRLVTYRIAGKDFTTLADIEEMTKLCRVQARDPGSPSKKPRTGNGSGSSATGSERSAQDALRATARVLKESLPNTSPASTTPKQAGAAVIPMRSK